MLSQKRWPGEYYERAHDLGVKRILSDPAVEVFAFQENEPTVWKSSKRPRDIFFDYVTHESAIVRIGRFATAKNRFFCVPV